MDTMIDWKLAATVAEGIAGLKAAPDAARFEHVAGPAEESARLVSEYTGLRADVLPHPEPVDRPLWIQSKRSWRGTVIDPVTDSVGSDLDAVAGPARAAGGALNALEVCA